MRQEIEQRRRELAACRAESGPIKHDEVEAAVVRGGAELKVVRQVVPHRAVPGPCAKPDVHERTARQTVGPRFRGRRRYGLARFAAAPSRIRGRGERGGAVHLERGDSCAPLRVCGRITMLRTRTATSGAHVLVTRGCAVATGRALGAVHVLVEHGPPSNANVRPTQCPRSPVHCSRSAHTATARHTTACRRRLICAPTLRADTMIACIPWRIGPPAGYSDHQRRGLEWSRRSH